MQSVTFEDDGSAVVQFASRREAEQAMSQVKLDGATLAWHNAAGATSATESINQGSTATESVNAEAIAAAKLVADELSRLEELEDEEEDEYESERGWKHRR